MASNDYRIVRPNLGNPLILKPSDLKSFEITVTHKPGATSTSASFEEIKKWAKQNLTIGKEKIKLVLTVISGNYIPSPIMPYKEDYGSSTFAETSCQQQFVCGYMWEMRIKVGLSDTDVQKLQSSIGWPTLLNIGDNTNAVYVHETLADADDFTILQITDTHIARRNDQIPEILCQVRNNVECEKLKTKYINFNDNLRAFIKHANEKWKAEKGKVVVILTGDIVDYYYDGWWDGKFIGGQGGHADRHTTGEDDSNLTKFREIILGTDRKGEALLCPIFTILGNHDYIANEYLLNMNLAIKLLNIKLKEKDINKFDSFGLNEDEAREYDYWSFPRDGGKYRPLMDRKNFKENIRRDNWQASLNQDWSYWLVKPKSVALWEYLHKINFDLDLKIKIGKHQFLLLNTGQERYPTVEEFLGKGREKEDQDYVDGGPHSRGITGEHINILKKALADKKENGFVFIFTHAPLFGLQFLGSRDGEELYKVLFEAEHEKQPHYPNEVSRNLEKLYNKSSDQLVKAGFPLYGTKQFKQYWRDPELSFNCADGEINSFLRELCNKKQKVQDNDVIFIFSGHTHYTHEFRLEFGDNKYEFYMDEYSSKFLQQSPANGTQKLARALWLLGKSPFHFTSGALKNKKPDYREIVIKGNAIDRISMENVPCDKIVPTSNFTPGCRIITLQTKAGSRSGNYVSAEKGGGGELVAKRDRVDAWETFELFRYGINQIALKTSNGQFVKAEKKDDNRLIADQSKISKDALFTIFEKDDIIKLVSFATGKYVDVQNGILKANQKDAEQAENFKLADPPVLKSPTNLSPKNGQVFKGVPLINLSWGPVAGASKYYVEIQIKEGNNWYPIFPLPIMPSPGLPLIPSLTTLTNYSFNFPGHSKIGHWRVWAIGTFDQKGEESNWYEFQLA
ncbi:metallophosphoesterase [candidate division KSB1 bacterium]|nr:metallophosphoesterase [candidate division KSB1 bacterium]